MSRGFGCWERRLLHATASICITPVGAVVRSAVPEPGRDDHASARRAAKSLATRSLVTAAYVYACQACGQVQDRAAPVRCCGVVRSSLAVARPGRVLPRLAPAPAGAAPAWIGLSAVPAAPHGLPLPTVDDVAQLALRRLWEALERGTITVRPADVVMLTRLAEREHHAGHLDERWQASVRELLWLARRHLGDGWGEFITDVRSSETLQDLWPRPGP